MKKIIFLLMLASIGFSINTSAQNAINSIHFYDVKNVEMEKTYLASIKEINAIIVEIGFPKNYYSCYKLSASDTTKIYRSCTIGHWNSESEYKAIHDHPKFKAWAAKNKDINAVYVSDQLYRRFYLLN
jgi:predicted metalloendopeptidase